MGDPQTTGFFILKWSNFGDFGWKITDVFFQLETTIIKEDFPTSHV